MIRNIKQRGLRLLFEEDDRSNIRADLADKAKRFLDALHAASTSEDVALPRYSLHSLKGDIKGYWSAMLSRNHRIIFCFEESDAYEVDLVDYR